MTTICKVEGAHKNFGAVRALAGVDVHIDEGEIVGIVGPNGSGKTTLFNCMSGFSPLTGGRILWTGRDVTRWPMHRIARDGLIRTFQRNMVFSSGTVDGNMSMALNIARRTVDPNRPTSLPSDVGALLDFCGIAKLAERPAAALSQGESRLLAIALTLAVRPVLLLLDEPAAGLNDYACDDLAALLRRVRDRGVTVAVVDHHMGFVMPLVDRLVVLSAGVKLAEGSPQEVVARAEVMEAYLGHRLAQLALEAWGARASQSTPSKDIKDG